MPYPSIYPLIDVTNWDFVSSPDDKSDSEKEILRKAAV